MKLEWKLKNMTPGQVVVSFFIAAIITVFFAGFLRTAGPWKGFWIFFIIIFFVSLAAFEWVSPKGPSVYGYYWIPGLFVAVIFALLLAAVTPKKSPDKERKEKNGIEKDSTTIQYYSPPSAEPHKRIYQGDEPLRSVVLGSFLWIFLFLLMTIVIIGAFFV